MLPLLLVDAFAERPFAGNPAAVCLLPRWPADRWLGELAAEMKQSETAYLVPAGNDFELRWFTPACEVDLCGHATLASAAVLWHRNLVDRQATIVFHTRSGPLSASRRGDLIELDFPATTVTACTPPDGLVESLGVIPKFVGRTRFDLLLELESEAAVRAAAPDFRALRGVGCRGVIITARSARPEFDFVSRFFAPGAGIDEDPVTGSAHCALAPYWGQQLQKTEMTGYQASSRGGLVRVALRGERVLLAGRAIVVFEGQLTAATQAEPAH